MKKYLEVGKIASTHGIAGEVRVQAWCDEPSFLLKFKRLYFDAEGKRSILVRGGRVHGNVVLLRLDGIESMNSAALLRDKVLYIDRADAKIPKGSYFIQDLIGCRVFDADNTEKQYGTLTDVTKTGANDVWHITDENGKEYLVPSIPPVVIKVDVESELVLIRPLGGIFDED